MSRDEGWLFLVLGRSLERVDMTARLISTRVMAGEHAPSWTLVLRSCGAYETFLRTYRGMVDSSRAAEFLLLDRLFPRSVFAALTRPRRAWSSWSARRSATPPGRGRRRGAPHRRPGPHQAGVHERAGAAEPAAGAAGELQRTCSAASAAVTHRYFTEQAPQVWVPEEAG